MKRTKLYSVGLTAIMIFAFSQQTFAQYTDSAGINFDHPLSAQMSTMIWNKINESAMNEAIKRQNKGNSGVSKSKSSNQASAYEVPAYRRYPAVQFKSTGTRLTLQEYVDALDGTPQDKAETKELIAGLLDKYDAEARAKGLPNDLALALVSYIALNGYVYNQKTEEMILPFEQNVGMRDVLAEYAAGNGIFDKLTDRQKQEIYEVLVMTAALTHHFYEKAKREKNSEDLKTCKLVAARNLKFIGIEP